MKSTKDSPAVQFIQFVWSHSQKATGHSWLKLNHALLETLNLAIRGGMRFDLDDFEVIAKRFNSGYWIGDGEQIYQTAVLYRNASAYHAFEQKRGRKPFIIKGARVNIHTGDGPVGGGLERLVVGAEFVWNGERVTVSSFNDANGSFTAVNYVTVGGATCVACHHQVEWPKKKLYHRYTITHQDIRDAKKAASKAVAA